MVGRQRFAILPCCSVLGNGSSYPLLARLEIVVSAVAHKGSPLQELSQ